MSNIESSFLGRKARKKTTEDYDYVSEKKLDRKFFWNS
jgi:hypothetical protein